MHAESTNCMQRRSCFAIPLREQKVENKNGGEIYKFCNYPRFLYSTRPFHPYYFQADQIWCDGTFNLEKNKNYGKTSLSFVSGCNTLWTDHFPPLLRIKDFWLPPLWDVKLFFFYPCSFFHQLLPTCHLSFVQLFVISSQPKKYLICAAKESLAFGCDHGHMVYRISKSRCTCSSIFDRHFSKEALRSLYQKRRIV